MVWDQIIPIIQVLIKAVKELELPPRETLIAVCVIILGIPATYWYFNRSKQNTGDKKREIKNLLSKQDETDVTEEHSQENTVKSRQDAKEEEQKNEKQVNQDETDAEKHSKKKVVKSRTNNLKRKEVNPANPVFNTNFNRSFVGSSYFTTGDLEINGNEMPKIPDNVEKVINSK